MNFLDECIENKIVAIVRKVNVSHMQELAEALYAGGIRMMEITFDQSCQEGIDNTLNAIKLLSESMKGKMEIGAGTVLTINQVSSAHDAGARFMITPNTNEGVINRAKELSMGRMIGAFTATEVEAAYSAGADVVKIFPAGDAGPGYIKNLKGPLEYIPMACVGGVGVNNVEAFMKAGCCCAGIGGSLVDREAILSGRYEKIAEAAKELLVVSKGMRE